MATVKASGGWDESDPIVVEVNTYAFAVTMRFVDGTWRGGVSAR